MTYIHTYVIICFCQFVLTLYLLIGNQNLAYKKKEGIESKHIVGAINLK